MLAFSAPDIIYRSPGPVAGLSFGQESIVSAVSLKVRKTLASFNLLTRCRSSSFIELDRLFRRLDFEGLRVFNTRTLLNHLAQASGATGLESRASCP